MYSLKTSLKTYIIRLDMFIHIPFQLLEDHTVLQSFWYIELILAICVLSDTHIFTH